jgi:ribosome-associated translation inhibitor RaiA
MRLTFTGRKQTWTVDQEKKVAARMNRLEKLVRTEKSGGEDAHGVHAALSAQRHLTKAEVTLRCFGRDAAGAGSGPDEFHSVIEALAKLEAQVMRLNEKHYTARKRASKKAAAAPPPMEKSPAPALRRVTVGPRRKPMTVEEAILAIAPKEGYLPFRDAETGSLAVLIRRGPSDFDLVEA